jgi:glycosyltransferase involved in cell wall biosynthesis
MPSPHKALMIAHYFPPGTSSGTLRTVAFAKYLPEFDWQPLVLTMHPSAYHSLRQDASLAQAISPDLKVHRTVVWAPDRTLARWKKRLSPSSNGSKSAEPPPQAVTAIPSRKNALAHLRDWFQFPDAYGGWLVPALWRGYRVMKAEKVDVIYSTAPSPVAHMIAMGLKKLTGCAWVADFRDPWECLFPDTVYIEGEHALRQRAEVAVAEKVVRRADLVIANTARLCSAFYDRFPDLPRQKFVTIPNGFDSDDFTGVATRPDPGGVFTIAHLGTFFDTLRSPDEVLVAIRELVDAGEVDPQKLRVKLVGCGPYRKHAAPYLEVIPRVAHHESLEMMAQSHVLLLLQQSPKYFLQVPAKTYEYMATGQWILTVAGEGATRDTVAGLPNGIVVTPGRADELKAAILKLYRAHLAGSLYPAPAARECVNRFSRKEQTRTLACHFSRLLGSAA